MPHNSYCPHCGEPLAHQRDELDARPGLRRVPDVAGVVQRYQLGDSPTTSAATWQEYRRPARAANVAADVATPALQSTVTGVAASFVAIVPAEHDSGIGDSALTQIGAMDEYPMGSTATCVVAAAYIAVGWLGMAIATSSPIYIMECRMMPGIVGFAAIFYKDPCGIPVVGTIIYSPGVVPGDVKLY